MTNAELNLAIAKLVYPEYVQAMKMRMNTVYWHDLAGLEITRNYCSNWNDLIPLMIQNNVAYLIDASTTAKDMATTLLAVLQFMDDEKITQLESPYNNYYANKDGEILTFRYGELIKIKTRPRKKDGYTTIWLTSINGKRKNFYLHRVMAKAFFGDSGLEVNHIDGNKSNNALSNLEYVTRSENQRHRYDVLKTGTGTEKPVIRSDGKRYPSIASVEADGFRRTGVYKVCAGQMKTHKGYGWKYE